MTVDRLGAHWRRFGTAATWRPADYTDGGTGTVIFDAGTQDALGGAITAVDYEVLYRAAEFVGMTTGDELEIAGVCYQVRDIQSVDDGAMMRATLSRLGS